MTTSALATTATTTPSRARRRVWADLVEVTTELVRYRELLYELTVRDIRIRYKQAVMGFAWALFVPLLVVVAGMVVRFAMAYLAGSHLESDVVAAMTVKAVPWAFFVGAIGFATPSLTNNMTLVTKVYFPREVVPLSATLAQAFDSLVGGLVLVVILPFLGIRPSAAVAWVPALLFLLLCFTAAAALFLSCANLFFRDVKYIVQVLLTFGIFFTPVFFEPVMLGPTGSQLVLLNPLAPILEGFRLCIVQGHNLLTPAFGLARSGGLILVWSPWYLAYAVLWSVAGLIGSALLFHRLEFVFAEYV